MIPIMVGINAINANIKPTKPRNAKTSEQKGIRVMDRIWRINERMSRGTGMTIDRVMKLEGTSEATARLTMKWLHDNGFVTFEMIPNARFKNRLTTRLYKALIK